MMRTHTLPHLPSPEHEPQFYEGIVVKRFIAWVIDGVFITILTLLIILFTALTALFVLGFVTIVVSLIYRWLFIASWSATPGMIFMKIRLRDQAGARVTASTAFWHTVLFLVFKGMFIPQVISIFMMFGSRFGQSLHDALCGVVAINHIRSKRLVQSR